MPVSGKVKEFKEYSPKIGFFQAKIIAISPDLSEIAKFQSIDNLKEPDYSSKEYTDKETSEKFNQCVPTFYLQAQDGSIFRNSIYVVKKERPATKPVIIDGVVTKTSKVQFINNLGSTTWAEDENALHNTKFAWFTKRPYRRALIGEEEFYDFLQKWLCLDWKDPDTQLEIDLKKMFNGNFKELKELLQIEEYANRTVVGYALIHTAILTPTDENPTPGTKTYQNVWKKFLPGNVWRYINVPIPEGSTTIIPPLYNRNLPEIITDYVKEMSGKYGSKDYCGKVVNGVLQIEELRDYNSSENQIATGSSSLHESTGEATTGKIVQENTITKDGEPDDLPF